MGEVGRLGDHPGHRGLQVHHPCGDLLVIEFDSYEGTQFAIELEQDLLAAKWIVRRSLDQLTFRQKLPRKQGDGAAAQVGEGVDADARDRALLVDQGLN